MPSDDRREIQAIATSTTVFLGMAARGPLNKALRIRSVASFKRQFGSARNDLELAGAIGQFFRNGGNDAWVVRVGRSVTLARIKKGLAALDRIDVIKLLVLPGLTRREWINAALAYAAPRRAFVIVDPPRKVTSASALVARIERRPFRNGANGAMFFPWLKIASNASAKQTVLAPPSGTIAGLFARNDRDVGIWKAPAGKSAALNGVLGLASDLTETEIDELHARGINSLRKIPNNGIVSWSARTLASDSEPQTEWKYIPSRRLALFIEESVERGTQWAVFETNDEPLWVAIRSGTEKFLKSLWQQGAFAGNSVKDAFFVKCDRTTMTQGDIDNGRLIIVIGVAVLKPAEFVIFRIGQWTQHCQD